LTRHAIPGGYGVCGGTAGQAWYAGVLVLDTSDAPFLETSFSETHADDPYETRVRRCRRWEAECVARPRRIVLAEPDGDGLSLKDVATAERIDGPACPRERVASPVLAWTERRAGGWEFVLHSGGTSRTIIRRSGILRFPQVAILGDGPIMACERDSATGGTEIAIFDNDGRVLRAEPGRNPKLVAAGSGVILVTELATANSVTLRLARVEGGDVVAECELSEGDYLMNPSLAWSEAGGEAFIAAESTPALGYGSQMGLHRTVHVWRWRPGTAPELVSGEAGGALPVERRAFQSIGPENLPPIQPHVFVEDGLPVVAFRQFRWFTFKTFGWDVFWCRLDGDRWTAPVRLSPSMGTPDTSYGVLPVDGRYVALFPALENPGGPAPSTGHRVEIFDFDSGHALERYEVSDEKRASYRVPAGYRDIAPAPPRLPDPYEGRTLVWGDLHVHSTYSKCVGAADGTPDEHLRFARDVLGCDVFTLTDHSRHMTGPESTWVMDRLEMLAGDGGVVLYSSEPGFKRFRHSNWYAADRESFERLERMLISQGHDLKACLRHVREELRHDSALVMRHFHGYIADEREMLQSFEPELEVAMEAMQGRCNAMLEPEGDAPRFPNQFLNAGCKVALLGGTDHYRSGPNHFCLTGFWVRDLTPAGVWEAIRNRYTIAMSDAKVAMTARLEGEPAGGSVAFDPAAPVTIRFSASCARPILRATLIRDGEVLPWTEVGKCMDTFDLVDANPPPGRHWYVPTIEVGTAYGEGDVGYCHASPFYVMVCE
jgi:hypothetical protein